MNEKQSLRYRLRQLHKVSPGRHIVQSCNLFVENIQISKYTKIYSTIKIFTRYCCSYVREKKNVKIFPILNELRNLKPNDIIPVFRDGTRFSKNTNYHFR